MPTADPRGMRSLALTTGGAWVRHVTTPRACGARVTNPRGMQLPAYPLRTGCKYPFTGGSKLTAHSIPATTNTNPYSATGINVTW